MFAWLNRLLGGAAGAAPPAAGGREPPGAPARRAGGPAVPAASRAAPGDGVAPDSGFGLKRPMVGARGGVAGFEFLLPPGVEQRLLARRDVAALSAHHAALLAAARPVLDGGRAALLRLPAALLARPALADQVPPGAMVAVTDLRALPGDIAQTLRRRGVKLGVPDGPPADAPDADFVLLQAVAGGLDTLRLSAQRWQEARPRLLLAATGLAHVDDVEAVLRAGVGLAGGQLDRAAAGRTARPLNAAAHRICELMNLLLLDRDTSELAQAVRADVALSYRLLRYAGSPGIGVGQEVETIEQAVMLLGRNELQRWLSVLLMSAAESRQASRALQELALVRGRLLELLALHGGQSPPQALFSVGLLSMLEVLLQLPLATALAPLKLGEQARQALLEGGGPWAGHLALAAALLNEADEATLERLAAPWGGVAAVQALAEQAWAWAATVLGASGPSVPAGRGGR